MAPTSERRTNHSVRNDVATGLRGVRILVVEDELDQATSLGELLAMEGMSVALATSSEQAIERALAEPPDIVAIDVGLPDRGGVELLSALRDELPTLPAVLVTGFLPTRADIQGALRLPRTLCVEKPVDMTILIRKLTQLIRQSGASRA